MTKRTSRETKQAANPDKKDNPKLSKTSIRPETSASKGPLSAIVTLLTALVVVIAIAISSFTGVDVLDLLGISTAAPTPTAFVTEVANVPGNVTTINIPQGFGAQKGFWQVYFAAPTGSRDPSTYVGGIEIQLIAAINELKRGDTLDIAAFEFNLPALTQAVLDAKARGVVIRMVTDTQHGLEDDNATVPQLVAAGIPVVGDQRSAFMHNKFMIINKHTVWTGSWNYTINDTYRNNNNAIAIRSQRLVQNYQAEFNEMFEQGLFGPRSPVNTPNPRFTQDGVPIQVYFSPEDKVLEPLIAALNGARRSVHFMTFSFTDFDVASALLNRAAAGVTVRGIFETVGSQTTASELRTLFCAGLDARQDGNPFVLHHKVFIVDETTVITGSFNISSNATNSNDENLLIIQDADVGALFMQEFNRRWTEARTPTAITCQ